MIVALAKHTLKNLYGSFREVLFYDGQKESVALVMGDVSNAEAVLCRVHSACIFGHDFNSIECDCRQQMAAAQALIQEAA